MGNTLKEIRLSAFLDSFSKNDTEKYCFVLGAGASKSSGIPLGSELVKAWDEDLSKTETEESLKAWKDELGITDENRAEFYGDYYKRRFPDARDGYHYLEKEMEGKLPGPGYIFLAYVLTQKQHKVVITTNFDHLIEDAVNQWENRFPLVIGHESMAQFITASPDRPEIIKVHHDLLLNPKNRTNETDELDSEWQDGLGKIFADYKPVFIGYGGNDKSVMDFLIANADKFKNGKWRSPYWTVHDKKALKGKPLEFIEKADGTYIKECDFDSFMAALCIRLGYELPKKADFIEDARKKAEENHDRINYALNKIPKLSSAVDKDSDVSESARIVAEAVTGITEAADRADSDNPNAIFRSALDYALNEQYEEAEGLFRKATELEPDNADFHDGLAFTLHEMKRYDEALVESRKAVELEPDNAYFHDSLAFTLHEMKRYDEALAESRKAVKLEPDDADFHDSLAVILRALGREKEAKKEERIARELRSKT